jgi:hypothetical protein
MKMLEVLHSRLRQLQEPTRHFYKDTTFAETWIKMLEVLHSRLRQLQDTSTRDSYKTLLQDTARSPHSLYSHLDLHTT